MPTRRFYRLLLLTFVLYMFANQTQVGWLYVMVSLLAGVLIFSWILNRRAIRQISAVREVDLRDVYIEGESIEIGLQLSTPDSLSGYQLRLDELCPVADPAGEKFLQQWFISDVRNQILDVSGKMGVTLQYEVEIYKRGLYLFPAVEITSRFPFGLFQRSNYSDNLVPDGGLSLLIYPEIRPLARLPLLDRQLAAEIVRPRPGGGNEFLALRPYRYGDSPRHIHWRTVARTGQLVSKEFADESLPGMGLMLDRRKRRNFSPQNKEELQEHGRSKHTSFETAVKIAASLGDYALRHGHALTLIDREAPRGAVTADMLAQYLARVEPDQDEALSFLEQIGRIQQSYIAVVLPHPDQESIHHLIELKQQGRQLLVILLNEGSFPAGGSNDNAQPIDYELLLNTLQAQEIICHLIGFGDDWSETIGDRDV